MPQFNSQCGNGVKKENMMDTCKHTNTKFVIQADGKLANCDPEVLARGLVPVSLFKWLSST